MINWQTLLLTSSLMIGCLKADSPYIEDEIDAQPLTPQELHFPYDDSRWFAKATLLVWKPSIDDLDYGDKVATTFPGNPDVDMQLTLKKPHYNWGTGVRVVLGAYLFDDRWDFSGSGTYYYSEGKSKSSPHLEHGVTVTPLWPPIFHNNLFGSIKAIDTWSLNFFTADLILGREYAVFSTIVIHPYAGARGAFIFQKNNASYFAIIDEGEGNVTTFNDRFRSQSDYWGIGPRVGTDFTFKFGNHWSLVGNFSAAIVVGNYINKGKYFDRNEQTFAALGFIDIDNIRLRDKGFAIRSNLEGSLGFEWEWTTVYKQHEMRIAPSIIFEASEWFDFNQFPRMERKQQGQNTQGTIPFNRLHGDLGLFGFNVNLQVDF